LKEVWIPEEKFRKEDLKNPDYPKANIFMSKEFYKPTK
jgi:hypothetical protein